MLLKFKCSNFKSIKEEIVFNMFAGTYKRHEQHLVGYNEKSILRAAAIYGANGSGKTNILLALKYLHRLVTQGTRDITDRLNIPIFKLDDCSKIPTKFEVDFLIQKKRFNYTIEIFENVIIKEELYQVTSDSEIVIFKRAYKGKKTSLTIAPNRNKDEKERLREEIYADELRENQPFFKESVNKKIVEAVLPFEWFSKVLQFVSLDDLLMSSQNKHAIQGLANTFLSDPDFFIAAKGVILEANVGISDIRVEELSLEQVKAKGIDLQSIIDTPIVTKSQNLEVIHNGELYSSFRKDGVIKFAKISTVHKDSHNKDIDFKFSEESKGVQRLFELLPVIYRSIHKGEVFVIDEIETSFHPVLIKEIITIYLNATTQTGQLIFTTHESHLLDLDLFRQDEIWFCEKDKSGYTRLYSLAEFKPRFDKDIRKGYFEGQFGSIPFLGDISKLGNDIFRCTGKNKNK